MSRTVPGHVDSVGKLVERLALLSPDVTTYQGKQVRKPCEKLYLAPSLLREFSCVAGCTACCLPFTLDLTHEEHDMILDAPPGELDVDRMLDDFEEREVVVNGHATTVMSYPQYEDDVCPYLKPVREGGALGCSFHPMQPLECAAAPNLLMTSRGEGVSYVQKRPFGRGWAWKDQPRCDFTPLEKVPLEFDLSHEMALLRRYQGWADHLGIRTFIPEILEAMPALCDLVREAGGSAHRVV